MLSLVPVDNRIIGRIGLEMLAACFYAIIRTRAVSRMFAAILGPMLVLVVRRPEGASRHSGKTPGDSNAVLQ